MARPYRKLSAFKHSTDHGKTFRSIAICDECRKTVEPPDLLQPLGETGTYSCDWCGALNAGNQPAGFAVVPGSETGDLWAQMAIDGFNAAIGVSVLAGTTLRKVAPAEEENLPSDCVDLDIAYSPIIPISGGTLKDAVECIKINEFTYEFEFQYHRHVVSAEKIKEMRARYLATHGREAKKFLRENNPPGSIWHRLGSLPDEPIRDLPEAA